MTISHCHMGPSESQPACSSLATTFLQLWLPACITTCPDRSRMRGQLLGLFCFQGQKNQTGSQLPGTFTEFENYYSIKPWTTTNLQTSAFAILLVLGFTFSRDQETHQLQNRKMSEASLAKSSSQKLLLSIIFPSYRGMRLTNYSQCSKAW